MGKNIKIFNFESLFPNMLLKIFFRRTCTDRVSTKYFSKKSQITREYFDKIEPCW